MINRPSSDVDIAADFAEWTGRLLGFALRTCMQWHVRVKRDGLLCVETVKLCNQRIFEHISRKAFQLIWPHAIVALSYCLR
jgi:hypothetical protein